MFFPGVNDPSDVDSIYIDIDLTSIIRHRLFLPGNVSTIFLA